MIKWIKNLFMKQPLPRQPLVIENIGPNAPKLVVAARILSYTMSPSDSKNVTIMLRVGNTSIQSIVPVEVQKHYPLGTDIRLIVEKTYVR